MQNLATRPGARTSAVLATAVAVAGVAVVCYRLATGAHAYASTGDSFPGILTATAEPLGYFLTTLAAGVTLGGLLYVVVTAEPDEHGVIDTRAFRTHLLVERVATGWAVGALVMVVVQTASDAGAPVSRLVAGPLLVDALRASTMAHAWVVVALVALVVAVTLRRSVRWIAHVVLLVPVVVGVVALPVTGNASTGPDHDYATSAAIPFAVALAALAGIKVAATLTSPPDALRRRVLGLEVVCGGIAVIYGVLLLSTLIGSTGPTASSYGWAGVLSMTALLVGWIVDAASWVARRSAGERVRVVAGAVGSVGVLAAVAAMATQPAPALLAHQFTTWDVFLGYELPVPPSVATILTAWRFDSLIGVGALLFGVAYLVGYLRLRRRGDRWPAGRLAAWLGGCVLLLFTSSSGVKAYGSAMFSVHMAEHMTLNMFVPVLLVLGGPVTLALRVLPAAGSGRPAGAREWLLWLVHSKVTAFLGHPIVAFVLFVASLYAVYFTPIFDTLARYHWGHELMSIHFLLVGYLFFWGIVGIDPGPRRLPFLGRLGLLFAVMPFHAFFGIVTMTTTTTIGGRFYRLVDLPWLADVRADQHLGGAIAWGSSELPVLIVVVALVAQWASQDRRVATRSDRHADATYADDGLDAYNAMLRELARGRR